MIRSSQFMQFEVFMCERDADTLNVKHTSKGQVHWYSMHFEKQ